MVDELERRRASAALRAVDDDEIGANAGLQHGLAHAHEFPEMPDAELEPYLLAAGELAQARDEAHQLDRRRERRVPRGRDAIHADRHAARLRDLGRHLRAGQHAAMAGLGALRELDLDHLDLRRYGLGGKPLVAERAVVIAAAEIAAAELPDQVAAVLAMIPADAALAGIVREAAEL